MAKHGVCPWWAGYFLINPLRRLTQDPAALLAPYVHGGMTVLEPGPGMGFFTLELARLVGPSGRVIAAEVEPRMIEVLKRRAKKAGLAGRIDARAVPANSMELGDLREKIDWQASLSMRCLPPRRFLPRPPRR
jgi:predicted methyltransferase